MLIKKWALNFELSYNKRLEVVNIERNKLEKLRDELKTLGTPEILENIPQVPPDTP